VSTPTPADLRSPGWQTRPVTDLPASALVYVLAAAGAALGAGIVLTARSSGVSRDEWVAFAVMAGLAALAELFVVFVGRNQSYHTAIAFVLAGVLLLPPELLLPLAVVQHVPEWTRRYPRRPWYVHTFNVSNFTLNALGAWAVADLIRSWDAPSAELDVAVAGLAASVAFVGANHLFLAIMLRLGRGHSFRSTGLFTLASLGGDLMLAATGVAVAFLYRENPWLVPALLASLAASHRSHSAIALLRASEERFAAIFDNAAVAATIIGLDGRIQHANRFMEETLGYAPGELVGLPLAELQHPDEQDDRFAALAAGELASYRLERRLVRRDGGVIWMDVSVALVRNAHGRPDFAVAIGVDVTERRELEDALRQSQKMEAIGQLAGGIAHDFNNVLTAISGYAELAALHVGDDELLRDDVREIERAAQRAAALTRQLLAFSRKQIMRPERLDVNDAVRELESMLKRLIGEHIRIELDLATPLPLVSVDRGQLHQVIVNLVVNARDAMLPNGGTVTIRTDEVELDGDSHERSGVIEPGRYVRLSVADTGHGIDEVTMQRIFEPFFTTKEPGRGTGLGLSTVYGIVKQSGGYIAAESEPGNGAEFIVYLPALDASAPQAEEPQAPAGRRRGSETVLLVEDEDVVRTLVRQALEPRGYEVLVAGDGEEALALAEEHDGPIDLLLTDLMMPNLSGREVADRLKAERPGVKVLYMTGYADASLVGDGVLEPGTALIEKPFSFAALDAAVRSALDDRN
jgi:PAS domain S-box-containing protein